MEKLDFEQMENINGGKSVDSIVCNGVMTGVGIGLGALGTAYTAGTAAWAMWGLASYISVLGAAICP